jgi:PhnB protein
MATQTNTATKPVAEENGILDNIIPMVSFDGDCKAALEFYQQALGGQLTLSTYDQMPQSCGDFDKGEKADVGCAPSAEMMEAARQQKRVMHARLVRNGQPVLMANDVPPGAPMQKGQNYWLNLACRTAADLESTVKRLGEGGQVTMPPMETFFAQRFSMVTDKFGVNWMLISGEKLHG